MNTNQANKARIAIAVRIKGERKSKEFSGIDAAVRELHIPVPGTSVLKRIRSAVQESETVETEFGGVTYLFSQASH